jgi:putative flippase GtrA
VTTRTRTGQHVRRFVIVGIIGVGVQLAVLELYVTVLDMHYLVATIAAVETTLLHNFAWHRNWTWADRRRRGFRDAAQTLFRYNLTTGVVSALGNVVLMRYLVGGARFPVVAANLITIGVCSAANFILSDRVVFSGASEPDREGGGPPRGPLACETTRL